MNRLTNYLLICIALFFGLAILNDRLSKFRLFEGMTDDAEPKQMDDSTEPKQMDDSVDLTDEATPKQPKKKADDENATEESFVASETPVITHKF
jgi:hypothetical protein